MTKQQFIERIEAIKRNDDPTDLVLWRGELKDLLIEMASVVGTPGPAGDNGKDGAPGAAGANGKDGAPGAAGANGKDGAAGPAGANGKDGAAGPAGANGANGKDGAAGPAGANGINGVFSPLMHSHIAELGRNYNAMKAHLNVATLPDFSPAFNDEFNLGGELHPTDPEGPIPPAGVNFPLSVAIPAGTVKTVNGFNGQRLIIDQDKPAIMNFINPDGVTANFGYRQLSATLTNTTLTLNNWSGADVTVTLVVNNL